MTPRHSCWSESLRSVYAIRAFLSQSNVSYILFSTVNNHGILHIQSKDFIPTIVKWRSIYRSQPNAVVQIFAKTLCYKNHLGLDARKPVFMSFGQHRRRPACAYAQTDQHICYSLFRKDHICTCYKRIFNFLVSLCSWRDWFESSLIENREDRFSGSVDNFWD